MKQKRYYLLFYFVIIVTSCSKDSDITKEKYLESYTAYMIPYKYGQADEMSKFIWEFIAYNKDSTIQKREYRSNHEFDPEANMLWRETNTYLNGILKEKTENRISNKRKVYNYTNNLLTGIDVFGENGLIEKYIYEYLNDNKNANRMLYWWYYFDEEPTTHDYTYDLRGNMIKDIIHYSTVDYGILTWEYDLHNNMVKESYYSSETGNTSVQVIRKYTYDNTGKVSEYVFSTWFNSFFQKYIYQYEENGLITQINVFESMNGMDGSYEQKGKLKYEYNFKER